MITRPPGPFLKGRGENVTVSNKFQFQNSFVIYKKCCIIVRDSLYLFSSKRATRIYPGPPGNYGLPTLETYS